MRTRIVIASAMVVLMFGCGDDGISTNKDNVCEEIAKVACFDVYSCCAEGEIEQFLDVNEPRSETDCRADVGRRCKRAMANEAHSFEQKRVTFDSRVMNNCLESLTAPDGTCATIEAKLPWAEACASNAWVGAVADGAECEHGYECASIDSFCSGSKKCVAKPGNGQPCGPGCKSGLFCNGATCEPLVGAGQSCTSSAQCTTGLFCDVSALQPSCVALRNSGETCTGNFTCASNNCLPGTCSGTTQPCFTGASCSSHCSNTGNFCTTNASCGSGTCSIGGAFCTAPIDCAGGGTCVFQNQCLPATCEGSVVCTDANITVDYCTGPISSLPVPH